MKIFIATHKKYTFPSLDIYYPIQVGSSLNKSIGYLNDNIGDNISHLNPLYCELTALYWIWKNVNCNIVGLVHYRRYFKLGKSDSMENVLDEESIYRILSKYDIVLPKPKRYLENIANHYIHCIRSRHKANKLQLECLRNVIKHKYPSYLDDYDCIMKRHYAHMLNMFIMKKELVDEYCKWLFGILFELEKELIKNGVMFDRIMGSFSEFLFDVWINHNSYSYKEIALLETEKNLFKKIKWALNRMFLE